MKENNNFEQTEEIVITFRKIHDNFTRYWWICIITGGLAILSVIGLTLKEYNKGQNLLSKEDNKYQAVTMVYMEPENLQWKVYLENEETFLEKKEEEALNQIAESYSASVELSKSQIKNNIEQWYWSKNSQLMYDCMALLKSNKIAKQINSKLEANHMKPYDIILDEIKMTILDNSRCYTLTVRGENKKRVELIANVATEILITEAKDVLNIQNSKIIDKAVVNLYRQTGDAEQPYEIITEGTLNASKYGKLSLKSFISKKKLLLIITGILLGAGIIFVFVLLDQKVHTKEEMTAYFGIPFLGSIKKSRNKPECELIATIISNKCKKEGYKTLVISSPDKNEDVDFLVEAISEVGKQEFSEVISLKATEVNQEIKVDDNKLVVIGTENLGFNANSVRIASKVCQMVLVVRENCDERKKIEQAVNNAKAAECNILGYVLIND